MVLKMKKNSFSFSCAICAKEVLTQPTQIKYRNRKTCSRECRYVLQKQATLERRKTYTKRQLDRLARYSKEAEVWRKSVFERDNYTCQGCDVRGNYLEADHIKPWAYFPELRYELTNGRTLCRPCHDKTKMSAKRMREIYGDKALLEKE
jgi:5-methylcytosine-specific restriction endonuclease McrA